METQDKIHNPLFAELFRIALPLLEGYQSDLGHDTLRLAGAVPGERFLWGVRKHGTEMRSLDEDPATRIVEMRQALQRFPDHRWHLLEVTEIRQDGYCAGTIVPLKPAEAAPHEPTDKNYVGYDAKDYLDPLHHDRRDSYGYIQPVQDNDAVCTDIDARTEQQAARLQELWRKGDAPFSDGSRPSDPME